MDKVTIRQDGRKFDASTVLSIEVAVKADASELEAKAGHLVALINGTWMAFAKTKNPMAQTVDTHTASAVGVLAHDATLNSAGTAKARVIYAGRVWENFIREAGISAVTVPFSALLGAPGRMVFINEEA